MRKGYIIELLIFILIFSKSLFLQAGWNIQNPTLNGVNLIDPLVISQSGWNRQISGTTATLYSVYFTNNYHGITVGINGTILRTTNAGLNWIPVSVGTMQTFNSVYFIDVNTGFIAGNNGIVIKTTNGGLNWCSQLIETLQPLTSIYFINGNSGFVVGNSGIIFKTTNGGLNWVSQISLTLNNLNSVYFVNANTGFVVGTNGTVRKTTNGGVNWISQMVPTNSYELTSIYFIDSNIGIITKANYDYTRSIYRTTNGGNQWYEIYTGSPHSLRAISFPNSVKGYLIGDEGDFFETNNSGANWSFRPVGVMNWFYDGFFINENVGWIVGSGGIIMQTTTGGAVFVKKTENKIPKKYTLYQNFPNPFNPSTKIRFDIPNVPLRMGDGGIMVTLKIFDALGREVSTLVNESLSPGSYETNWNASTYSNGVYYYRLYAVDFVETKKMFLIK
jgi:photosystem II stability/assembly factor-like uncharacterized protein